jgi:hypothetical protein
MNARLLAAAVLAITPAAAETPAEGHERLMWEHALRTDRYLQQILMESGVRDRRL